MIKIINFVTIYSHKLVHNFTTSIIEKKLIYIKLNKVKFYLCI